MQATNLWEPSLYEKYTYEKTEVTIGFIVIGKLELVTLSAWINLPYEQKKELTTTLFSQVVNQNSSSLTKVFQVILQ